MQSSEISLSHYEKSGLRDRLINALSRAGLVDGQIRCEDLATLDQFHSRGLDATVDLANELALDGASTVIDIGSGLGGPSRYLASQFGCKVVGIDLSASFVQAATYLAERTGLGQCVSYQQANALSLPFPPASFDVAWTQHVAMNIGNRQQFYAEAFRVLKPGGQLAVYDVVSGKSGPLIFPVPWAATPEGSFLLSPEAMRSLLIQVGFEVASWKDRTEAGIVWFRQRAVAKKGNDIAAKLGLHVVMGPEFSTMSGNLLRNLAEGRAALIEAILIRP
ncbi:MULTISPECIES: class I SAM-dependent methyltransferase [unclassified Bradyrhizobium]|uniref:class I SAM-dependent methyltransferase n=1 Tax=unclassified Bradyrhizobium TaxID=2631580 RepID=UPI0028E81E22|nr:MULTISPECIES: class I SAM-dependent methyltransferase [unclassified Bradyrhizobium]